jgi:hypothetical protein
MRRQSSRNLQLEKQRVRRVSGAGVHVRCRAVDLHMIGAVAESFAQRARIAHGELERAEHFDAALRSGESHTEVGTTQLGRSALQQQHQRPIGDHGMAVIQNRRVDLHLGKQAVGIAAEASDDLGKLAQGIDADHRRTRFERAAFGGGIGLSVVGHLHPRSACQVSIAT